VVDELADAGIAYAEGSSDGQSDG
ncbi:MAG: hypothetical protein QOH52_3049, partial [Pseudonocardiales bacterium]|nr:hypothetical protein [Pseudonocardiales bacterium]